MNGKLGARDLIGGVAQTVYINNTTGNTFFSLNILNRSNEPVKVSVALTETQNVIELAEYIEYEIEILPKGVLYRTGLSISPTECVTVLSNSSNVNAVVWGIEQGISESNPIEIQSATESDNPVWYNPTTLTFDPGYFEYQLYAADSGKLSYSLASGSLPTGINLTESGKLYGTLQEGESTTFEITATDPSGNSTNSSFDFTVTGTPALTNLPYPTDGLYYDFDAADLNNLGNGTVLSAGTEITDRSSTVTSTIRGTQMTFNTDVGGYLDTTGATGYWNTADTNSFISLNNARSISVLTWAKSNGASRQVLVARYGSGYPNQFNHIVDPTGDFHYNSTGVIGGTSGDLNSSTDWWDNDVWFHCVWTYSVDDGIARWYVNGAEVTTVSFGTDSGNGLATNSTANFSVASRSDDFERLNGGVAVVRLYTRALTPTEISEDFARTRDRFGV